MAGKSMTIKENCVEARCHFIDFKEIIDETSLAGVKRTVGTIIMHMQEDVSTS